MPRKAPPEAAYAIPETDELDIAALKALARGSADEGQQVRVLNWIIKQVAKTYDLSYRPESERETVFAEGRRFVGLQIVKYLNLPMRTIHGRSGSRGPREQPD